MVEGNIAHLESENDFLEGLFEDEFYLKLKSNNELTIKSDIFEIIGRKDENKV